MVDCQLRTGDVTDYAVLAAMGDTPREQFVPGRLQSLAYIDEDLAVKDAEGEIPARYLMEPRPFARLVQLADVQSSDIVASAPADKESLFDPADSKIYRHPTFYEVPDEVECL